MNTGQQAKRFIHTTVARDKVLVRSRIYNKQAVRIVTDFCMDMLRPSGCSKNYDLVFILSDGLTCLLRLQYLSVLITEQADKFAVSHFFRNVSASFGIFADRVRTGCLL
ncbi:hypothetical protein [Neisseria elongata]|uniref:hypothetical protein n=1 Tax=Neisseria elongata TaxID=495 RepID=UPI0028D50293|nr:hypothetical protein [Neisseria elongata]